MAGCPPIIYTDENYVDQGAVVSYSMDMAFGKDQQDFEIAFASPVLQGNELLYIDGTEYGGVIDEVVSSTTSELTMYRGRTWHGILSGKILSPDEGQDYLVVSGEANALLGRLITRTATGAIFRARATSSGITITNFQFARYVNAYDGIRAMLEFAGAKLMMQRHDGYVEMWAEPVSVISNEADSDVLEFSMTKRLRNPNHYIAMGEGSLSERLRVDLYADESGTISQTQTQFGIDEIAVYYNYSGADMEQLISDGTKSLKDLQSKGNVETDISGIGDWYVGDILEARDNRLGTTIRAAIVKKIVKVSLGALTTEYEVGQTASTSSTVNNSTESQGAIYQAGKNIDINGNVISLDEDIEVGDIQTETLVTLDSIVTKRTGIDATQSDNGVSSTQYPGFIAADKNNRGIAAFESVVESDGSIAAQMYARNYDSAGSSLGIKGLRIDALKDGSQEVSLVGAGAQAAWLSALGFTKTSGVPTKNSSAVNGVGYTRWYRYGDLVIVAVNPQILANLSAVTNLFTGLPAPSNRVPFTITRNGGANRNCYIDTSGNIVLEAALNDAGWHSGLLVYIVA